MKPFCPNVHNFFLMKISTNFGLRTQKIMQSFEAFTGCFLKAWNTLYVGYFPYKNMCGQDNLSLLALLVLEWVFVKCCQVLLCSTPFCCKYTFIFLLLGKSCKYLSNFSLNKLWGLECNFHCRKETKEIYHERQYAQALVWLCECASPWKMHFEKKQGLLWLCHELTGCLRSDCHLLSHWLCSVINKIVSFWPQKNELRSCKITRISHIFCRLLLIQRNYGENITYRERVEVNEEPFFFKIMGDFFWDRRSSFSIRSRNALLLKLLYLLSP